MHRTGSIEAECPFIDAHVVSEARVAGSTNEEHI